MSTAPAGWYPDPADDQRQRYWDGAGWTHQIRADPQPSPSSTSGHPPAADRPVGDLPAGDPLAGGRLMPADAEAAAGADTDGSHDGVDDSRRSRSALLFGVGAVVLVAVAAVVWLWAEGSGQMVELRLEPVGVAVEDAFTSSVAVAEHVLADELIIPDQIAGLLPRVDPGAPAGPLDLAASTPVAGSSPGLFGGTRDQQACDPDQLVAFLASDLPKAQAWAAVHGIDPADIGGFVAGLTPLVLTRDVQVTNHGFVDGQAYQIPAVLQAGTAVLVDDRGVPVVKCGCGNPLLPAAQIAPEVDVRVVGRAWPGWHPDRVVIIGVDTRVERFVTIDLDGGDPFLREVGPHPDQDHDLPDGQLCELIVDHPICTQPDPQPDPEPDPEPASDDDPEDEPDLQSDMLGTTWTRIARDEAVFGGDDWQQMWSVTVGGPGLVAVGTDYGRRAAAAWTSTDGLTWQRVVHDEDVFGGQGWQSMWSVTAGGPGLVAVGSDSQVAGEDSAAVWTSSDGLTWQRVVHDEAVFGGQGGQSMSSVTAGGPGLVAVGSDDQMAAGSSAAVWTSPDGIIWQRVVDDEAVFGGQGWQSMLSVTAGGPGLVAVGEDGEQPWEYPERWAAVWTSPDGLTWQRVVHDEAVFGGQGWQSMRSVTTGGPGLVAVGFDESAAAVWVSPDGLAWQRIAHDQTVFGADTSMASVTVGGPGLVAVGDVGFVPDAGREAAAVWTSPDGIAWQRVAHDEAVFGGHGGQSMMSVTAGGPGLVAVGRETGQEAAVVWTSP